jgi:hypothetical protein
MTTSAGPELGGMLAAHMPPGGEQGAQATTYPYPAAGIHSVGIQAGVVKLDLVALSIGLQKLSLMRKFSGIAFESAISDLHEQVRLCVCRPHIYSGNFAFLSLHSKA